MSGFKFDPSKPGLRKILREWEELALRCMWDLRGEGAISRAVWERVNEGLGEGRSISRASIILFLEKLEGQGVLGSRDATGKGGHHKIYHPLMDEKGYRNYLLKTVIESMRRDSPEATREVLEAFT